MEVDPLGYVIRFVTMFFFVVLVHEASHALADPGAIRGLVIGFARGYGIVLGFDVERVSVRSALSPQAAVPVFLIICVYAGWMQWYEAVAMGVVNVVASAHDLSALRRKPRPVWIRGIGIYREPPRLRIGWL